MTNTVLEAELYESDAAVSVAGLFREHHRTLVAFLRARLRDRQEAEEVAQEAYVKLLQLGAGKDIRFLRSYLFRVAHNLSIDRLRQRRSRYVLDCKARDSGPLVFEITAERAAIADEEVALLKRAIEELSPRCREAFHLSKVRGLELSDVARVMGVTERMVRKYIARTLAYVSLRREGYSPLNARIRLSLP